MAIELPAAVPLVAPAVGATEVALGRVACSSALHKAAECSAASDSSWRGLAESTAASCIRSKIQAGSLLNAARSADVNCWRLSGPCV